MTYSLKPPQTSDSRVTRLAMIAATGLCLIGAVLGVPFAIISPMLFDGPMARFNPAVWLGFALSIGFWAVCLAAPLAWGVAAIAVLQFL